MADTANKPDPVEVPADVEKKEETLAVEDAKKPKVLKREKKRKKKGQRLINEDEYELLQEKSKKADEYYGHYVQARADLDNLRKRGQREREEYVRYANDRLLSEIIPIIENFERALTVAEKVPATHNFAVGVEMILKQLREVLGRYGVEEIFPENGPFDPAKHEAADSVETTEHPDHTVLEVLQRGYALNGRVIQPAVVRVAVNPQAPTKEPVQAGQEPVQAGQEPVQETGNTASSDEQHDQADTRRVNGDE